MNILNKSGELTMAQLYKLSKSPEIAKLSTVKGEEIEIAAFLVYEDESADGSVTTVASFETVQGELYASNSVTFVRDFRDILAMCVEAGAPMPKRIKVLPKVGKSGREYLQCVYIG